jgi:hypothetical protein
MDIYFLTSTDGPPWKTGIAYQRFPSDEPEIWTFDGTEPEAILVFASEAVNASAEATLTFHCKPNVLRNAFEQGWIEGWALDGFVAKPEKHRERWAHLYGLLKQKNICLKFEDFPPLGMHLLTHRIINVRLDRIAPGDPVEDPWEDRSSDLNDAIDRAIKRDR